MESSLALAALVGVVIYAAIDGPALIGLRTDAPDRRIGDTATPAGLGVDVSPGAQVDRPARRKIPEVPIPSAYGMYAVNNGVLTELDVLPIRIPDQRIAISSPISTASRTHLPSSRPEFVVLRRDLVNSAPDRVVVRVVAQVTRALTFDRDGKAKITPIDGTWVVRGNSYPMRVAPVADNPEMIVIRPDAGVFFPAGRYALVLKGAGYDFTIDGPITDAAHCLERADALTSPVYTECRNP